MRRRQRASLTRTTIARRGPTACPGRNCRRSGRSLTTRSGMPRGTNLPALGGYNQTLILDLVRRSREGISRVELAEQTGLSAQTISNVSRRLLDDGLIREGGKQIAGPGKPRTILHLEPTARYAVGVHL